MRGKFKFSRIVILLAGVAGALPAEATTITAVVGASMSSASINPAVGYSVGSHSYQYGAGVTFGFSMLPAVGTELGLIYLPRGFAQNLASGSTVEYTMTTLQFPLMLRVHLMPSLSIGAGAYFSHAFVPVADPSGNNYGADDYGITASLRFKFGLFPFFGLVIDGRYLSGLADISKTKGVTTYLNDMQLLAGFEFGK